MKSLMIAILFSLVVPPIVMSAKCKQSKRTNQSSCQRPTTLAGIPGIPGAPGRDGRDGREGIQGKPGPQGPAGQQGATGTPGKRGKTGARGPKGPKGDRGPVGLSSRSNWKECVWKSINDGRDNGLIRDCVFYKKRSDTVLFVFWNGDFRVHGCTGCCKRWFFTFNGAECKSPAAIDGIAHPSGGISKSRNVHHVRTIQGHCEKIQKGRVRVGFNVGNCAGYGNADAYTGWNSVSRVYVEEVPRPQP